MESIRYKGYEVEAVPHKLADSGEWSTDIVIMRDRANNRKYRKFGASNTYKTQEEAVQHCFNLGKQIIDGKAKDCSVADL